MHRLRELFSVLVCCGRAGCLASSARVGGIAELQIFSSAWSAHLGAFFSLFAWYRGNSGTLKHGDCAGSGVMAALLR